MTGWESFMQNIRRNLNLVDAIELLCMIVKAEGNKGIKVSH